jgi:hypothetical protein
MLAALALSVLAAVSSPVSAVNVAADPESQLPRACFFGARVVPVPDDLRKEKVTLKPRPLEKSDAYETIYGEVASRAGRLRTIVTRPKGTGKHPALFLIQGIGLASIDNPVGGLAVYRTIIVYGTIARTWTEYWLENVRRQMELAGARPSAIDSGLRAEAALATYLYAEKKSPHEIALHYPHLRERLEQTVTEDRYFFDRSLNHGFNRAASRRASFDHGQSRQPGEFNPAILGVARAWVEKIGDEPALSALERAPEGWTDLVAKAGPQLKGWTRGPLPAQGKLRPASQWSLDASTGYLVCQGDGGHEWLRWDQELGDFIYHVEWRFTPLTGKKGYNSGVYARNSADARIYHQAQTGDQSGGYLFGTTETKGAPKRFNLSNQQTGSRVKPAGEWNTFEIRCQGQDVTLWVNGAVTNQWHDCEVKRGHVGLEAEGWRIEFRNVKVKPLSETGAAATESNG